MTSKAHRRFLKTFEKLPVPVQDLTRKKYSLWKQNPFHFSPGLEERRKTEFVLCESGTTIVRSACAKAT